MAKKTRPTVPLRSPPSDEVAEYRASQLDELRRRAELSMDRLAKAMGFKGQSSIQRYLSPDYNLGLRPEMLERFKKALVGRGNPPILEQEINLIANEYRLEEALERVRNAQNSIEGDAKAKLRAEALQEAFWRVLNAQNSIEGDATAKLRAVLPLPEGPIVLETPSFLSPKSIEFLKAWLEIVGSVIASQAADPKQDDK